MSTIREIVVARRPGWDLAGPQRKAVAWDDVRRLRNARARHADTIRRLFAVGPWTVYVMRYRPGLVDEDEAGQPPAETKED